MLRLGDVGLRGIGEEDSDRGVRFEEEVDERSDVLGSSGARARKRTLGSEAF